MTPFRLLPLALAAFTWPAPAQEGPELYRFQSGAETRWASPENPTGAKGAGAQEGAPLTPVTIDPGSRNNFQQLLTNGKALSDPSLPDGHTNYYRSDDVAAVAYFYLERAEGALPAIGPAAERTAGLRLPTAKK